MAFAGNPNFDVTRHVGSVPIGASADVSDFSAPAAATAAILTFAATQSSQGLCLAGLIWSYSAAPTGGNLTITASGVTIFNLDITAAGIGQVAFVPPKRFGFGTKVVATLASGAGAVVGKLNSLGHWSDPYGGLQFGSGGSTLLLDFSRTDDSQYIPVLAL